MPGPENFGHFCDRRATALYQQAIDLAGTNPPASRQLVTEADHELVDDAAVVPIWNSSGYALTSARLGNWLANPQYGPLLAQLWVR